MSRAALHVVAVHRRSGGAAGPHWRFGWLFAAPHRLAFAAAAAMFAASALWWAVALLARSLGAELPWALPPAIVHGLVMGFGITPLFFTGFLFTAGPKWLGQPAVAARALVPPVLAQLCGWVVFLLAAHGRDPEFGGVLGGLGLAAVSWGWSSVVWRFVGLLRSSRAEDRVHASVIAAVSALGALALWAAAFGVATGRFALVQGLTLAALWGFVGVVFATVSHRMIPFFSAAALPVLDAWRPRWLLWALVGTFGFETVGAVAELAGWPLAPGWRTIQAAVELPVGIGLLMLAVRWGLVQSLRIRLLAMLHLGFFWLGIALLLAGTSHALMAATDNTLSLGLAPLHAYTMGFLGSTLIAMVTRVSCGHGGRTLTADDFVWRLFWFLQLAVLLRVGAGVLAATGAEQATPLLAAAAVGWAGVCVAWAARYGHWYGTPRADGRPG
jgi:uncharacterized protein involved in response to NO